MRMKLFRWCFRNPGSIRCEPDVGKSLLWLAKDRAYASAFSIFFRSNPTMNSSPIWTMGELRCPVFSMI